MIEAHDADSGPSGHVTYRLRPGPSSGMFAIDPNTGEITTEIELDRETQSFHHLIVIASDMGLPPLVGTASVTVQVDDRNDNPPSFDRALWHNNSFYVSTLHAKGHVITRVTAHDPDTGRNAEISYELVSDGKAAGLFQIDSTGEISVASSLAELDGNSYELTVIASDAGNASQSSVLYLYVFVNTSAAAIVTSSKRGSSVDDLRYNLTIVVSLAVASGLVTVCLVMVVVFIRQQHQHRGRAVLNRKKTYNCRMEAIKTSPSRDLTDLVATTSNTSLPGRLGTNDFRPSTVINGPRCAGVDENILSFPVANHDGQHTMKPIRREEQV